MLTGKKPDISKMQKFGSVCYAYKQDKKKLGTRCEKGVFIGYDKKNKTKQARVFGLLSRM